MGLSRRLAELAVDAAHVLVVESPGAWRTRVAVEQEVDRRGWRLAGSPAAADALVVAGVPGRQLSERIESVWVQLPGPRARTVVSDASSVSAALDAVRAELLDTAGQVRDARERDAAAVDAPDDDPASQGDDMDTGGNDGMDMGGDDGMDMGDMGDMGMAPSGIPLAEGGADRDGLEMDVLHLPLGPVLTHWPAGLVLHCTLQGDVVVAAEAELLDDGDRTPEGFSPAERAARRCDEVASLLALAGWADGQVAALRARDTLLADPDAGRDLVSDLQRRVRRARMLRWSLRGIGVLRPDDAAATTEHLLGNVHARLLRLADRAGAELSGDAHPEPDHSVVLGVVERLVVGLDLAAARLVVASLAIDTVSPPRHAIYGTTGAHHD